MHTITRVKRKERNDQPDSTQNILLEIAAGGPPPPAPALQLEGPISSTHSPIVIDDERASSAENRDIVFEDRAGDALAEDAPSSKKSKTFRVERSNDWDCSSVRE